MATLLRLPTEVWREWIIPLLPLHSVMRLDSAATNHQTRSHFLLGLSGSRIEDNWSIRSKREWEWSRKRLSFPSRNPFSGSIPHGLFVGLPPSIPQIREIYFFSSNITDDDLGELLWSCSNLTRLVINRCKNLTDDGILRQSLLEKKSCRQLNYLTDLDMDCPQVTDRGINILLLRMPNLTQLKLGSGQLSVGTAQTLAEHCRQLQNLTIMAHHRTSVDAALLVVIHKCTLLTALKLHHSLGVSSEEVILALAEHRHQLTTLAMPHSHAVTDRTLLALIQGCSQLNFLDIMASPCLTSEGIIAAIPFARNITELRVGENHLLTDVTVVAIAEHCPLLRILDISSCVHLGAKSLWALRDHAHCLRYLHIEDNYMHARDVKALQKVYQERGATLMVYR